MVRDENGTHFDRPSPVYDQKEFVPLEVKSGALVVIHGDLIHQSFENLSPASRHAFSLWILKDVNGPKTTGASKLRLQKKHLLFTLLSLISCKAKDFSFRCGGPIPST
eukprot:XP_020408205.1 phytanoyl-CoA dioxygenase 1 [Zea mays]